MMADLLQVIYVLVYHLSILKQNTVFTVDILDLRFMLFSSVNYHQMLTTV